MKKNKKYCRRLVYKPMERTASSYLAVFFLVFSVATIVFLSFFSRSVGLYPIGGLSMEPTIHQPLYVPFGEVGTQHRGAYVHIIKNVPNIEVGDIVLFTTQNPDGGRDFEDVKRVAKITKNKAVWLSSDNVGWTGADSRDYGWVEASRIVGVVDNIFSPRRFFRSFSQSGRLRNVMELKFAPEQMEWSEDGRYVAIAAGSVVEVFDSKKMLTPIFVAPFFRRVPNVPYALEWRNGKLIFMPSSMPHLYEVWDPPKRSSYRFLATTKHTQTLEVNTAIRVFVTASQEDLILLASQGKKPSFYADGKLVLLTSPQEGSSLASWDGMVKKIIPNNCLINIEAM